MKKAIILAVLAFVVTLVGSSAALVMTHHPAIATSTADSARAGADSLKHASIGKDSLKAQTAAVDSTRGDTGHGAASDEKPVHPDSIPPLPVSAELPTLAPPHVTHAPVPVDPVARAAAYKQVARVLSAMKPPEAVKVLDLLSDDEVEGILRAVGPRQAADFLANLPRERAASLSRRLLVPKPILESR